MTEPLCSIIIPTYNKDLRVLELSLRGLESLALHVRAPFEVILVDNASPQGCASADFLRWIGIHRFDILRLPENAGFGKACNIGFRAASAPYLCQMNTDAELVEDSVNLLIGAIERFGLDVAMPEHYENCLHYGLGKSDELMGPEWRFGAFWVARADAIRRVGGFDEGYEMCYWEDMDLWRRMEEAGFRVAGWRGTWVKHVGNASALPQIHELFEKNRRRYESRWGKSG